MKRVFAALLALVMCLSLCACGGLGKVELPPVPTAETVVVPTEAPRETETPAPVETEAPTPKPAEAVGRVLVSVGKTEEQAYDPQFGETLILTFSYETPVVIDEENPDAADRVNEFIGLMNEAYITGEDYGEGAGIGYNNMLTYAEENYGMQLEMNLEYPTFELTSARHIAIPRNDGKVLTLLFNDNSYTGGVHGSYSTRGYSFDMASGEKLTLGSLSSDEAALRDFLTQEMARQAREDAYIRDQIEGFVEEDTLEETLAALLRSGSWYLDYEGMEIFSDLYEISSYAAGMVSFRIPNEKLLGHVDERFLAGPAPAGGEMRAVPAEEMVDGSMEIVDMVKVFDEGTTVYLVADGPVQDLRVSSVDYFDYNGSFNESAVHWSCSGMENAAVQLVTEIPDGMPNLKIAWRGAAGEQSVFLTQSGEDGSLILMPGDSIEAVG